MIKKLYETNSLSRAELITMIKQNIEVMDPKLQEAALQTREKYYKRKVFFRGLLEISNHCKNNCFYCGIRASNLKARRYRLTKEEILASCQAGYQLGFKTFVLQGGEDPYNTDEKIVEVIEAIKKAHPDCAVTLSLGEKSFQTYQRYYEAGADRYLLRHETATSGHYRKLHPKEMTFEKRKQCLYDLKEIGFQVGAGFMVSSPHQTIENMADDLLFLKKIDPHMVGIGPFIPHQDTIFAKEKAGGLEITLLMLALTRLLLPKVLLPATTALGTIDPLGREKGLMVGANVIMPNLSPKNVRTDYSLYDNKASTGDEAAESITRIAAQIKKAGFTPDFSRGDYYGLLD